MVAVRSAATSVMLIVAFKGLGRVAPDEKEATLVDGISHAMIPTSIGLPLSLLSYLVSILSNSVGSLRRQTAGARST